MESLLIANSYDRQSEWSVLLPDCELKGMLMFLISVRSQQETAIVLAPLPDLAICSIAREPDFFKRSELYKLIIIPASTLERTNKDLLKTCHIVVEENLDQAASPLRLFRKAASLDQAAACSGERLGGGPGLFSNCSSKAA